MRGRDSDRDGDTYKGRDGDGDRGSHIGMVPPRSFDDVCVFVCVCACMCVRVCVCGGGG